MRAERITSPWRLFVVISISLMFTTAAEAQLQWRVFASLKAGRHHHVARYLNDEKILVIGGYVNSTGILGGTPTNTTEIIDLRTAAVTEGPSMTFDRTEFPSLVLPDGDILVFGGHSQSTEGRRAVERYDVTTGTWSVVGQMAVTRRQHCADFLSDDEVLIFGGFYNETAELYTISTGTSRRVADLPSAANSAVSINPDGRGPSFWGFREGGADSDRSFNSIMWDVVGDRWLADLFFDEAPVAPKLTVQPDGSVLVISGATGETFFRTTKSTWLVSPDGVVSKGPSLIEGRQWHVAGPWADDQILVASGLGDGVTFLDRCEWVWTRDNTSTPAPTLNVPRAFSQMIMARAKDGRMRAFVISGLSPGSNTVTVEVLEDSACANGVTSIPLVSMRRAGSAAFNGNVIALTGTGQYETGSAWIRNKVPISAGFDITFRFRLSDGNDNGQPDNGSPGADGIAIVFQTSSPTALGKPGDGIGYNEMPHGLAVEFDSYLNPAFSDPSGSHVAVQVGDGRMLRPWHVAPYLKGLETAGSPNFVADGSIYVARIVLEGTTLRVYCGKGALPAAPTLTVEDVNMQDILRLDPYGACYVGFASSTGKSSERHELLGVEITGCDPLVSSVDDGVEIPRLDVDARVMPNPAIGEARLQLTSPLTVDVPARVVDMHGRVSAQFTIEAGATDVMIPMMGLASGTYRVVVGSGPTSVSLPLVVVR